MNRKILNIAMFVGMTAIGNPAVAANCPRENGAAALMTLNTNGVSTESKGTQVADPAAEALDSMNQTFISIYEGERKAVQESTFPVILSLGDSIYLYRSSKDIEGLQFIPFQYPLLKAVDHLPLAIFVLLRNQGTAPALPPDACKRLTTLKTEAENARRQITKAAIPTSMLERQESILDESCRFIKDILQAGQVEPVALESFVSRICPLAMQNADDAEDYELSRLDKTVQKWKSQLSQQEWNSLQVVVTGSHMARLQQSRMQYFSQLLQEPEEGNRIIYAEGVDNANQAMVLLATHNLDRQISRAFFGSNDRMHRDLLSDAAKRYLQKHPPNGSWAGANTLAPTNNRQQTDCSQSDRSTEPPTGSQPAGSSPNK